METNTVRLVVDFGAATTVAALGWADGRWNLLQFDGRPNLPSSVFVREDGVFTVGREADRLGAMTPERLVRSPKGLFPTETVDVAGTPRDVVDLIAATLHRVHEEASRTAGSVTFDVRFLVAATWGPKRRTQLRQAAARAGFPTITFMDTPVAVVRHLRATGHDLQVGSHVLVCDLGTGIEASVVRIDDDGSEVVSPIANEHAGGASIDAAVADFYVEMQAAEATTPDRGASVRAEVKPSALAAARAAKEALSAVDAVVVPAVDGGLPVLFTTDVLRRVAGPVIVNAVEVVRGAIAAAGPPEDRIVAVYCVGAGSRMPLFVDAIRESVTVPVTVVEDPDLAAVLGPLDSVAGGSSAPVVVAPPPPYRRILSVLLPGAASVALVTHDFTTTTLGEQRDLYGAGSLYVVTNSGELAMAGVFALIACLSSAAILASLLPGGPRAAASAGLRGVAPPIGVALLAATAAGLGITALYAAAGAIYFNVPTGPFLRWALLPNLIVAVLAVVAAIIAPRVSPAGGWHAFLNFPVTSTICAALGMILIQNGLVTTTTTDHEMLLGASERLGGLLLGVGAAAAIVRPLLWRLLLAVPLGVVLAFLAGPNATGTLGVIYIGAVAWWWALRLWYVRRGFDLRTL